MIIIISIIISINIIAYFKVQKTAFIPVIILQRKKKALLESDKDIKIQR